MHITSIYRNKMRNIHARRPFSRTAGYSSAGNKPRGYTPFSAMAVLLFAIVLGACPDGNTGSTAVTNITITDITATTLTLNWVNPTDSDGFRGVLISADPAGGTLATAQQQEANATTATIAELNPITTYTFTFASVYTDSSKNSTSAEQIAMTATSASLPIDGDDDGLVDITSLERLDTIRYNLNLRGGPYKGSAADSGTQCGTKQDIPCNGFELIFSLDFANPNHYESGKINAAWRPNTTADNSGTILSQHDATMATNAGWEPLGSCNADSNMDTFVCNDGDEDVFATRLTGNGYTISNLYARNTNNNTAAAMGLVGIANHPSATINAIGMVDAFVHGSNAERDHVGVLAGFSTISIIASYATGSTADGGAGARDYVGGLVGANEYGTISASYVSDSTANGGMGNQDLVGALVGLNLGTIIASYVSGSTANGGMGNYDNAGGLVGWSEGTIIASYASDSTANGGMGNYDNVGGLVGSNFHNSSIITSYATATTDGGTGSDDDVGSLVGSNSATLNGANPMTVTTGTITASYGFGNTTNVDTAGDNGTILPSGVTTAAQLTAPGTATATAVANQWSRNNSQGAWYFGTTAQAPALRYADYDGTGNTYGCGEGSNATFVIPSVVATPTGPMAITCGTTLLPGQGR